MKKGFKGNVEKLSEENSDFRRVLYTGEHSQLVLMSLLPGEEIGEEVHNDNDQFFRFEKGTGKVTINDITYEVGAGDAVIVPVGAKHNVKNTGLSELKLYTIYSPAHHKDGTVRATRSEAAANEASFDGKTTE